MTARERRLREQANRHQLILATAREMAEEEGWDNVTTRRLADRIEYSQPVLYQHFKNKDAIVHAVATEGLGELTAVLRASRPTTEDPREALHAAGRAYAGFAARWPALYQAMLVLDTGEERADEREPQPLLDVLAEIQQVVEPVAEGRDPRVLAEVVWSAWHGLVTLTGGGRLTEDGTGDRLLLLTDALVQPAAQPA
ncbi:TetR/AcrR family transcriptional regulator [Streptomyces sp. ITFR-16]|uniref:TetR/AcrR family transcriptional regulator n=1 Tax=Streptomyces sp. ITFR-16 TaxID=3075198 RepID=UPI00288AF378|nr:TetR/AcrR family transcriptional regulator [Streptomyces sp. ITFR-16]WNI27204.1 TetR/AcrR family transcriptional regulator [Streptomyces sp. ITFR-16]